ncbi:hypothetical protein L2E82_34813 [Cichorium intybus]|uniref:Uncharacterized protein n=1 Tax=Cichorium intybus TaxID=13427 RepID=A0ACB9BN14_CICIN|nr:hypothetical protein L2E82_34813 [Cichorium intybus]
MSSPSPGSVPWWSGLVTGSTLEDSITTKPSSMDNHTPYGSKLKQITPKPSDHDADQVFDKRDATQFNIFPGNFMRKLDQSASDSDDANNSSNTQKVSKIQADYAEIGFGQPTMLCGKYPFKDQCYGVLSTYGPQITGRIMLPLNLSNDDGPIFVNAKQYNGIIRRRRSRAKAEMANKVLKNRKPYLHHSRHLHAIRRPRGNGGRFLNTKKKNNCKNENTDLEKDENPSESPNYAIFMSNHNSSSHDPNSSMFSMGDLKSLPIGNLSMVSFSEIMSGNAAPGHSFGMHGKWVTTTGGGGGRCNFTV